MCKDAKLFSTKTKRNPNSRFLFIPQYSFFKKYSGDLESTDLLAEKTLSSFTKIQVMNRCGNDPQANYKPTATIQSKEYQMPQS